jgi:DNA (cytosine-5)-methyltransferase 1
MNPITFGSLFAGIGGIDLGFERCGMKCKWQVEINDYAQKVLAKHWPKVHRERDIRECSTRNLERVDIIAGGFPCQDISYAGLGAGLDGERSGLFFEAIRLVRELQPRAVVLENVAALLTRGLDRVLGTLAEIGYDAEWHCIPAAYVGAPHIRDRVFVLAYANSQHGRASRASKAQARAAIAIDAASKQSRPMADTRCKLRQSGPSKRPRSDTQAKRCSTANDDKRCGENVADTKRIRGESKPEPANARHEREAGKLVSSGENVADTDKHIPCEKRLQRSGELLRIGGDTQEDFRRGLSSNWATEPDVGRVAHGISARVDRLRGLGNAVVPQVAELVGKMVLQRLGSGKSEI